MSEENLYQAPQSSPADNANLSLLQKYAWWVVKHPFLVILGSILITLALAAGGKNLVFTNDYRVFFSEDNPQLVAFEELQDAYTRSDNILVMLEPKDGDVFSCLLYTSPSPRDLSTSRMPSSA